MSNLIVARNKVVALSYVLRNERGEIYEYRDLPVSYLHGSGADLFPRIERALEGKRIGDRVTVKLAPGEAFGAHDPKLTFTDDINNSPPELRRIGAQFEVQNDKGEARTMVVTRIEGNRITVDANHPLAGQTVTFEVKVESIRDASPEEIHAGRPADGQPSAIQ